MDDFDTFDPAPIGGSAAHQQALAESNAYAEQQAQEAMRGALSPPKYGFERFLERGMSMAGGRTLKGDGKGAIYRRGWAKGLTKGQAEEKMRGMYGRMSPSARARYEDQANMRDVRTKGEMAAAEEYRRQRAALYGATGVSGAGDGSQKSGAANNTTSTASQPARTVRVPNIGEKRKTSLMSGRIKDETGDRTAEIVGRTTRPPGVYSTDKPLRAAREIMGGKQIGQSPLSPPKAMGRAAAAARPLGVPEIGAAARSPQDTMGGTGLDPAAKSQFGGAGKFQRALPAGAKPLSPPKPGKKNNPYSVNVENGKLRLGEAFRGSI